MASHMTDNSPGSRRSARISAQTGLAPGTAHAGVQPNSENGARIRRGRPPGSKEKVNRGQKPAGYADQAGHRAKPRTSKRSISKPGALTRMPVEILTEIAKYLHPLDLLLLSRTNKFFRGLFMGRGSALVWRSAQSTVSNLPPCPGERLGGPQYAALLFTRTCSVCGGSTPRPADPIFLVRLCARCCAEETIGIWEVKPPGLVIHSYDLVPGKESEGRCMYYESLVVKAELNKITATGNQEKIAKWIKTQKEIVNQRQKEAEPLRDWIHRREWERASKLEQLKSDHEKEVKSRLLGIGWDAVDFKAYSIEDERRWNKLVHVAKPLGESAWTKILPKLLEQLDKNRKNRLALEKETRRRDRTVELRQWVRAYCRRRAPLVQATTKHESVAPDSSGCDRSGLAAYSMVYIPERGIEEGWPGIQEVLDRDLPADEFIQEVKSREDELSEIFRNRVSALEARLAEMIPQDIQPAQFGNVLGEAPVFTYTTGTGDSVDTLPESTRKLLRADVLFGTDISDLDCFYYPEDLPSLFDHPDGLFYNEDASKVAKVLLAALGCPNASFIELNALKLAFRCGRCNTGDKYYDWPGLVRHYILEAWRWKEFANSLLYLMGANYRQLFTHDLETVGERPLVHFTYGTGHLRDIAP